MKISSKAIYLVVLLCFFSGTSEDSYLKLMSFNIRYGTANDGENSWPLRNDLVMQTIRDFSPDVLGVQEALSFQLKEIGQAFPAYNMSGVGRDDGKEAGEYTAIFYDTTRFSLKDQNTFWFSDTPAVPGSKSWGNSITRICTWVHLLDKNTGAGFYVYNLHWDHISQPSREKGAELLLQKIKGRSVDRTEFVIMGDFNVGETNPAFLKLLSDSTLSLKDSFREIHPTANSVGTFNRFTGKSDGDKIDGILVSEGWQTKAAEIVRTNQKGRYPSDHFPVTAVVRASN